METPAAFSDFIVGVVLKNKRFAEGKGELEDECAKLGREHAEWRVLHSGNRVDMSTRERLRCHSVSSF